MDKTSSIYQLPPLSSQLNWREREKLRYIHTGQWLSHIRNWWRPILILMATAFLAAVLVIIYPYVEFTIFGTWDSPVDMSPYIRLVRFLFFWTLLLFPGFVCGYGFLRTGYWLHRNRFWVGFFIVVALVCGNVSGSSLNVWNFFLRDGNDMLHNVAFGIPRLIRSDEWAVNTPLAFSQYYNHFGMISHLLGHHATDMFVIKDAPVLTWAAIFRPFYWGYFVLGPSRGLAFYWAARLVVLFLAVYELVLTIGNKEIGGQKYKLAAMLSASLLTFSPLLQWWLAVNYLPEMISAMCVGIVCFNRFLGANSYSLKFLHWRRLGWIFGLWYCVAVFLISLYPSWQIPVAYIGLALFIGVIVRHAKTAHLSWIDWVNAIWSLVFIIGIVASAMVVALPFLAAEKATVYPGSRDALGGGGNLLYLLSGPITFVEAFKELKTQLPGVSDFNPTELSQIPGLFPLGILAAIWAMLQRKKAHVILILLIMCQCLFVSFYLIAFPPFLSKALLFYPILPHRMLLGIGLTSILLLAFSSCFIQVRKMAGTIIFVGLVALLCGGGVGYIVYDHWASHEIKIPLIIGVATFLMVCAWGGLFLKRFPSIKEQLSSENDEQIYAHINSSSLSNSSLSNSSLSNSSLSGSLQSNSLQSESSLPSKCEPPSPQISNTPISSKGKEGNRQKSLMRPVWNYHYSRSVVSFIAFVAVLCGLCVNPLQVRAEAIENQPVIRYVRQVQGESNNFWAVQSPLSFTGNLLVANGIPALNALQVTPNFKMWEKIDPTGKWRNIYNRYAFVRIIVKDGEPAEDPFKLIVSDSISVTLTIKQLKELGVTYILSDQPIKDYRSGDYCLIQEGHTVDKYTAYRIQTC